MKLSIIIPVYNEENTLFEIVEMVQKVSIDNVSKELLIINDASVDRTQDIIDGLMKKYNNIKSFTHEKNLGKGAAIRTGLKEISGDILVIQDGDLEYNPEDFKKMLEPILNGKTKVVFGSRMLGDVDGYNITTHYYGNKVLSALTNILYNCNITDMETCYKMMTVDVIRSINLTSNHFDIEPEITAQILLKKYKIIEIPISYNARSFDEGKKITWKDGLGAIRKLIRCRFLRN